MSENGFDAFAIVELMGHRRMAGHITEQQIAGAAFLRIDVPGPDGDVIATQLYAPSAVYAIHPVSEEVARKAALLHLPEPVTAWDMDRAERLRTSMLGSGADRDDNADDDGDDDGDDPPWG